MDGIDDNALFYGMHEAVNNQQRQRMKGYYACLCGNDFIKAIGRSKTVCPYCGRIATMVKKFDSVDEQIQHSIWRECGTYSDKRADKKEEYTENVA